MLPNHYSQAHPRINRPRNRSRSKLHAALALLALALLAAPHIARAQVQSQLAGGGPPSAAPELKVMTWNIRGGQVIKIGGETYPKRCRPNLDEDYLTGIAKEIRTHAGLDVIALQEVYRGQVDSLKPLLFTYFGREPDIYFAATLSCDRGPDDDFGIAIISRYKFSEGSEKRVPLCHPSPLLEPPADVPKCPTNEPRVLARVEIRVGGDPIHIYNAHFEPGGSLHRRMAELVIRQFDEDNPDRAVLLGDFYMAPKRSAAYKVILREFRDAWLGADADERKDCSGGEGLTHPTLKPTQREDYVFVTDGFRVDGARVTCTGDLREIFGLPREGPARDGEGPIFKRVPDHLPLTVRLALV